MTAGTERLDLSIAEARTIRERFVAGPALRTIPARRTAKLVVFAWLAERFDLERRYREAEVNELLAPAHADVATLRRGLVDEQFFDRANGQYWRTPFEQRVRIGAGVDLVIETERLRLRPWRPGDREMWAAMMGDARVTEFLGPPLERSAALAQADRVARILPARGYGWWVVDVIDGAAAVGVIVLQDVPFLANFTPAIEIGWHVAFDHWKHGYATEAALAVLPHAFDVLACREVVAMTSAANVRSQRVMERIGMTRDPAADFDHPRVPPESALRPHVLYRIRRPA